MAQRAVPVIVKRSVLKRSGKAIDHYINYAKSMRLEGDLIIIERKETYVVDLSVPECNCNDFQFNGKESPCKHIYLALLFKNSHNHDC